MKIRRPRFGILAMLIVVALIGSMFAYDTALVRQRKGVIADITLSGGKVLGQPPMHADPLNACEGLRQLLHGDGPKYLIIWIPTAGSAEMTKRIQNAFPGSIVVVFAPDEHGKVGKVISVANGGISIDDQGNWTVLDHRPER